MVFDVLSVQGESVVSQPYSQRRIVSEDLQLDGPQWRTPQVFDDGEALWEGVCAHELEGLIAIPRLYLPGERRSRTRRARSSSINNQSAAKAQAPSAAPTTPPRYAWAPRPLTHASGSS
jgi:hypothetical protein